ncbi:MAG: hypothetical protein Q8R92_08710 [Deltaproteobacteria bacterium]|nr:hypothetical protein [Deltaproteobacteria bacterium]
MTRILAAVLAAFLWLGSGAAQAAVCMSRDDMTGYLASKFNETQRHVGLVMGRSIMEIWRSDKGTWTIVMTNVRGVSCIVGAGEGWENIPAKVELPGAPS